jgi:predicted ATP-grasp superfamily ATP-dependent carboligase
MSTDLPTALREIMAGRLSLVHYLRSLSGPIEFAVFAYDDPLPGLFELPLLAYMAGKRVFQGRRV